MARSRESMRLWLAAMVFLLGSETAIGARIGGCVSGAAPSIGGDGFGCVNEGCARRAERGESLCATCGLEHDLFRRDARRLGASREG